MLSLSSALLLALYAQAQEGPETGAVVTVQRGVAGMGPETVALFGGQVELLGFGGLHGGKVVKGAPLTALAYSETRQTLADGTTITHKFESTLYRDADGRFRKESTLPAIGPLAASGKSHSFIVIIDPVAGTTYTLDPDRKLAHKMVAREPGVPGSDKFGPGGDVRFETGRDVRFEAGPGGTVRFERFDKRIDAESDVKKEPLGTQTINGVSAEGTRYTRTIPVGQIGNDRALTVVKEEWYSPDLQMIVQSKLNDPMFGQTVYSLTNIQRTAPNASLFSVPAGYTVKDAPGLGTGKRGHMKKADELPPPPPLDGPGPGAGPEM
jgi:hypothetical protein